MARIPQKLSASEWAKLPKERQELYVERNGTYFLDTDEAEELRVALDREKGETVELRRKLEAIRDVDPEEYQRLKTAAEQAARDKELEKGNFEKIVAQDREAHTKALKERDERESKLRAQLENSEVDGAITRAIAKYPGAKQTPLLLGAKRHAKLMEIDGKLRGVVLDEKGEPRLKAGAKKADDYMDYDDLLAEMRNDKEWAGNFPASAVVNQAPRPVNREGPGSRALADTAASIAQQVREGGTRIKT